MRLDTRTYTVRKGDHHVGRFSRLTAPHEFLRGLIIEAGEFDIASAKDNNGCLFIVTVDGTPTPREPYTG